MWEKNHQVYQALAQNKLSAFLKVFPSLLRLVSVNWWLNTDWQWRTEPPGWISYFPKHLQDTSGVLAQFQNLSPSQWAGIIVPRKAWQSSWQQEYVGKAPPNHSRSSSSLIKSRNSLYNLQGPSLATCSYQWGLIFHKIMLPARKQARKPWACGDIPIQPTAQALVQQSWGPIAKPEWKDLGHPFLCLPESHAHLYQRSQIWQSSEITSPQRCFKSLQEQG